jgi:hypothetical protein
VANKKRPAHRPSAYRKEYAAIAHRHCLLGATDADLAAAFSVSEKTINTWKQVHPEFLQSLKRGKTEADAVIAESLFNRAKGFRQKAVKIFNTDEGTIEHEYQEYYPPETAAAIFWLKNRQPGRFRQNPEVAVTVNAETNIDLSKPVEEWGANELEAELKRRGAMPVPVVIRNGNGQPKVK